MPRHFVFPKNHSDSQNYYYFSDGISTDELKRLFNDVALIPEHRATTVASDDSAIRSSIVKWIPQNDQWSWLYDKMINMATIANNALWNFDLQTAPEQIQFTEYHASQGGHYGWHQDIGPGMLSLRKVSITVQLSGPEDYQGGDLQIWQGGDNPIDAPKGKGTVVIFPSYMMHRVTKVTSGIRRSLVLWVGGEHYR
jgi:PKHD-type hydroxylase